MAGRYPLDRHLYIYAARPLSPLAREFLRLVLSREGQEAIAASPQGYLPLSERDAAAEREKLDQPQRLLR
jgi:phosphate transport system substrate-binding protein